MLQEKQIARDVLPEVQQAIKRRDELLTEAGLRAKGGRPENSPESGQLVTTAELAKDIGMSRTQLYAEKQIANNTSYEVQQAIKSADLPKNEALKIARLGCDFCGGL